MIVARRLAALCAALLVMLAVGAGVATAATPATASVTERIFADYAVDRSIDGSYSADDLNRALEIARESGTSFSGFASAVSDKYDRDILGLDVRGPATDDGNSLLPVPSAPGERDAPPWPFLVLTALGAALVLTGAGSSIYRRARR
jgi:hypothetical protein